MHHALAVPELRLEMCGQIESQETLAALAQTCTAFQHPSLNRLWSGELQPIKIWSVIGLLGDEVAKDDYGRIIDLVLTRKNRKRLFSYTNRIRYLDLKLHSIHECSIYEPALLKLISPPSSLERAFPRLRHLVLGVEAPSTEVQAKFLPPQLSSLASTHTLDAGILNALLERCPSLQSLDITGSSNRDSELITAVSSTVVQLPSLSALRCICLNSDALLSVSRSLCLRRLVLTGQDLAADALATSNNEFFQFQALEFLELSMRSIGSATALLRKIHKIPRVLKIQAEEVVLTEVQALFALLSRARGADELEELNLNGRTSLLGEFDSRSTFTVDVLMPLVSFPVLRSLVLGVHYSISLNLNDISKLARAFPKLEQLHFDPSSISSVPIHCLTAISEECPTLKNITIPLDVSVQEMPSASTHPQKERSSLEHLHLILRGLTDINALTRMLVSRFPSTRTLCLEERRSAHVARSQYAKPIRFDSTGALRQLCMLTVLSLKFSRPFALRDADLTELATALPRLTHLELLGSEPEQVSRVAVTLDGVWALTSICTGLRDLVISINGVTTLRRSSLKQRLEVNRGVARNKSLRRIDIPSSHISAAVARDLIILVAVMFPRLQCFKPGGVVYMDGSCWWMDSRLASIQQALKGQDFIDMSADELRSLFGSL